MDFSIAQCLFIIMITALCDWWIQRFSIKHCHCWCDWWIQRFSIKHLSLLVRLMDTDTLIKHCPIVCCDWWIQRFSIQHCQWFPVCFPWIQRLSIKHCHCLCDWWIRRFSIKHCHCWCDWWIHRYHIKHLHGNNTSGTKWSSLYAIYARVNCFHDTLTCWSL